MREAAEARGVELSVYWAGKPDEIGPAIESAGNAGGKALNVFASPMFDTQANREAIFGAVARARMPAIYQWPETIAAGASSPMVRPWVGFFEPSRSCQV